MVLRLCLCLTYWEWDELKNSVAKQHYLHTKLG